MTLGWAAWAMGGPFWSSWDGWSGTKQGAGLGCA
jgi:hypothetical protein